MHSILLILALLFGSYSPKTAAECTKLIDVIGEAAQNNGFVLPVEREHAIILYNLRIISFKVLNSDSRFYVEDRNQPLVRLFTTKNGCADLQWMIPRDFLVLMGIKRTLT